MGIEIDEPTVPPNWRQLGVLVLDGSGSMTAAVDSLDDVGGTKAQAVNHAVREMLTRFRASRTVQNFTFAVVSFHDRVSNVVDPTPASTIDDNGNYDPTAHGSGGTFIGAGLERAHEICQRFFNDNSDDLPTSAIVLLMTDGECMAPVETKRIAAKLTADDRITLAAAFFATRGEPQSPGVPLLRTICSDPNRYFKTVYDADTLRNFWQASMTSSAAGNSAGRRE